MSLSPSSPTPNLNNFLFPSLSQPAPAAAQDDAAAAARKTLHQHLIKSWCFPVSLLLQPSPIKSWWSLENDGRLFINISKFFMLLQIYFIFSFFVYSTVNFIMYLQNCVGFQALIQYQSRQSAVTTRSTLQGRNIYDGCCQLDIQFSNLDELQVNYNNDRSKRFCWDFTNPNLPTEQKGRSSQPRYGDAGSMYGVQGSGGRGGAKPFKLLWLVCRICIIFFSFFTAGGYSQMANAAAIVAAFGGGLPPGVTGTNDRCTILVANLNPDRIDEDKLFNLFAIYGNIVRIKLLRNKPDHALIQMGDGFQAELAVHFLKVCYLGAYIFTRGAETHEYVNSNLNRFNRNAAKNYRYCCSPTKMIHLSTLSQDITEEDVVSLVKEHGTIVNSKVFEMNGKKQALVQFGLRSRLPRPLSASTQDHFLAR
ncbi:hypothetical protein HN51_047935 [Arachis hypogaea]